MQMQIHITYTSSGLNENGHVIMPLIGGGKSLLCGWKTINYINGLKVYFP